MSPPRLGLDAPRLLRAGAVLAFVSGYALAGPLGLASAAAVLGLVLLAPPIYGFALGQIGAGALALAGPDLLVVEAGLFGLLVADGLAVRTRVVPALVVLAPLLAGLTWLALRWGGATWVGALALVASVAVLSYGLHRYERLALGELEGST